MDTIIREKMDQAIGLLDSLGLDAWMTFVRESSALRDPVLPLILGQDVTWPTALILTRQGRRIAIVGNLDTNEFKKRGLWEEVIGYVEGVSEPLRKTLTELDPESLGINYSLDDVQADGLTYGMYQILLRALEGTPYGGRLVSAGTLLGSLRSRKTATELDCIRKAVDMTEGIFNAVGEFARPGHTEKQIAAFMHGEAQRLGVDLSWEASGCPIVNSGPESHFGHGSPTDITLEPGHLLHIDFGVRCEGYCADLQRMWYVLRPGESSAPPDVLKAFEAESSAIAQAAAAIRPGVLGHEVDTITRQAIQDAGYPNYLHGTGHNVGLDAHDGGAGILPRWERYGKTPDMPLEEGSVFTIEPSIGDAGGHGCLSLEEMVVITKDGAEFLSEPQREIRLIKP